MGGGGFAGLGDAVVPGVDALIATMLVMMTMMMILAIAPHSIRSALSTFPSPPPPPPVSLPVTVTTNQAVAVRAPELANTVMRWSPGVSQDTLAESPVRDVSLRTDP
jgi:hypothetical protein